MNQSAWPPSSSRVSSAFGAGSSPMISWKAVLQKLAFDWKPSASAGQACTVMLLMPIKVGSSVSEAELPVTGARPSSVTPPWELMNAACATPAGSAGQVAVSVIGAASSGMKELAGSAVAPELTEMVGCSAPVVGGRMSCTEAVSVAWCAAASPASAWNTSSVAVKVIPPSQVPGLMTGSGKVHCVCVASMFRPSKVRSACRLKLPSASWLMGGPSTVTPATRYCDVTVTSTGNCSAFSTKPKLAATDKAMEMVAAQAPSRQACVPVQAAPQAPQFCASCCVSVQTLLHWAMGQGAQRESLHTSVPAQDTPQPPQFRGSLTKVAQASEIG